MEKNRINEEVEKSLESFNGLKRAEIDHFFYVKLKARMVRDTQPTSAAWMLFRKPAFSFASLLFAVSINVFAITQVWKEKQAQASTNNTSIQSFAKEYDLNVYTAYDNKIK